MTISFSFECKCKAVTIFKEIENVPRKDLSCAACNKAFDVRRDLVRFDRKDRQSIGLLANEDGSLESRIKRLVEQFEDIEERCERLEYLIMETRDEIKLND